MRKRGYAMILAATMVLTLGTPVINGEASVLPEMNTSISEEIMPRYEEIRKLITTFDITGTIANLKVDVSAHSSKNVTIKMILQRKDGDSWTRVQKWTKEGKGRQILMKSIAVTKGRKYRMKYTVTVGSETVSDKTAAKTA